MQLQTTAINHLQSLVPPPKDGKLTLLGLGRSIYDWISQTHDNFEELDTVWVINAGCGLFRHDVVFDMHTDEWIDRLDDKTKKRADNRREWLKNHDKPIIMPRKHPDYPTSVGYPLGEVIEKTGSCYFASGLAYPMALAFLYEVKQIKLFG